MINDTECLFKSREKEYQETIDQIEVRHLFNIFYFTYVKSSVLFYVLFYALFLHCAFRYLYDSFSYVVLKNVYMMDEKTQYKVNQFFSFLFLMLLVMHHLAFLNTFQICSNTLYFSLHVYFLTYVTSSYKASSFKK